MRTPSYPFTDWVWRWVDPPEQDLPNRDATVRSAMVLIAMSLSNGGVKAKPGRSQLDVDKFNAITENRCVENASYNTCCDVVGGSIALLGCVDERLINRSDDDFDGVKDAVQKPSDERSWWDSVGSKPWKMGANVTMLYQGAVALDAWVKASPGLVPFRGDSFLLDYGVNEHFATCVTDMVPDGKGGWRGKTVEGGQFDGLGQCVMIYDVSVYWRNGVCYMKRDGKNERVLYGWIDVTKIPISRPSLLPPIGADLGVAPAELLRLVQWLDIMSDQRPILLDDDPDVDFESLSLEDRVAFLHRTSTETLRHFRDQLHGQQDAFAGVLAEIEVTNTSIKDVKAALDSNTKASNEMTSLIGNYSREVKAAFERFEKRVKRLEDNELDPKSIGQLIGDIEKLSKAIEVEKSARERQDSIHDEDITNTKNKVIEAEDIAKKADEKASSAMTVVDKVKSQITPQNATKAGLTALALAVIEAIVKNWPSIMKWFN